MTYGGYPGGSDDPFGGGPFSSGTSSSTGPAFAPPQSPPPGETNTLATLSIVFAFVFAPAGAVLGHLALLQISRSAQRGRDRALIGLTLSYVFIFFAVIALVVWAVTASRGASPTVATSTTPVITKPSPTPSVSTTVITAPPPTRPTIQVEDLRVGDCVEVQQIQPEPNRPGYQFGAFYPVSCQVRDGVFRVDQISSPTNTCPGRVLINKTETIYACISPFKG
jgi:hypothetical protein